MVEQKEAPTGMNITISVARRDLISPTVPFLLRLYGTVTPAPRTHTDTHVHTQQHKYALLNLSITFFS